MNRNITTKETIELIERIKSKMPSASLRTTFIVGLPGETDKDYEELVKFAKQVQFEKLGVFIYSREEGTEAHDMPGQVKDTLKRERMNRLMDLQKDISRSKQNRYVGETMKILIEEKQKNDSDIYLGRSEYDAPEVDGIVYVHSKETLQAGDFVNVRITDSYEYDLVGEVA